ncbi:MAG: four helix bundle protein [Chlamydiae bacterium]|nr:four helix bundle protein [Chlamydiota bacterium]MBI3276326.1 four helix bundle protein [Chlamydiota bacterium]
MKSEKLKVKSNPINERSVQYALAIIRLYQELSKKTILAQILGKQLLRSGTSIGANVHEAQGAQSKADFISKISIAHKEALETAYWLRLIEETKIVHSDETKYLKDENHQLVRILSSILITSKESIKVKLKNKLNEA